MKLKGKKGFTLVELIIVIAILGVIAAIAAPSVTRIFNQSKVDSDKRSGEQILQAARLTTTQNIDTHPEWFDADMANATTGDFGDALLKNLQGAVMPVPKSAATTGTDKDFVLSYNATGEKFTISFKTKTYSNDTTLGGTYTLIEGGKWEGPTT